MKPSIILAIGAAFAAIRGLALMLAPGVLFEAYGVNLVGAAVWCGHFMGMLLLIIAAFNWFASRETGNILQRKIVAVNMFLEFGAFFWSVKGTVDGIFNELGWAAAGQHVFFLLLYAAAYQTIRTGKTPSFNMAH